MDNKILNNIDLTNIINDHNEMLTVKELLNIIDYNIDNLYIDSFWDSINDDKWIYINKELILWMGYKYVRIVKFNMKYQNIYNHNKVNEKIKKLEDEKINKKMERNNLLIDKFDGKKCVYIIEIEKNKFIKIGSTKNLKERQKQLKRQYNSD